VYLGSAILSDIFRVLVIDVYLSSFPLTLRTPPSRHMQENLRLRIWAAQPCQMFFECWLLIVYPSSHPPSPRFEQMWQACNLYVNSAVSEAYGVELIPPLLVSGQHLQNCEFWAVFKKLWVLGSK
jgi:hypothetical protein